MAQFMYQFLIIWAVGTFLMLVFHGYKPTVFNGDFPWPPIALASWLWPIIIPFVLMYGVSLLPLWLGKQIQLLATSKQRAFEALVGEQEKGKEL